LTFDKGSTFTVAAMDGFSISQVAERSGFPASTLRFYEQSGLVRPERTPAGYRSYGEHDLELLAFIGRAKGFGLSLEEIAELLDLLDEDRCAPVQGRLRDLIDIKIADAQDRIAELVAFTGELQRVAATLGGHTPEGPCDDTCGCTTDRPDLAGVSLIAKPTGTDEPLITCTLAPDHVGDRMGEWKALLGHAVGRAPIAGGVRVGFARDVDIAAIAKLVAAEQECCRFFTFALMVGVDEVALDVTGPPDAQPIIDALVGTAS
jgi:DNA-binding transcriptional MerR regulator